MILRCVINNFAECPGFNNCRDFFPEKICGRISCIHETLCENATEQHFEDKTVGEYYNKLVNNMIYRGIEKLEIMKKIKHILNTPSKEYIEFFKIKEDKNGK